MSFVDTSITYTWSIKFRVNGIYYSTLSITCFFLLNRENKKLRIEVENLEEDLQRKSQQATVLLDGDLKTLQFEFAEKNKVLYINIQFLLIHTFSSDVLHVKT